MRPKQSRNKGFTLVEVLAGMLFMAILIPSIVEGLSIAHRAGIVGERKREASRLAQQVLNEAIATESWRQDEQNQDFGTDWPGYAWHMTSADWSESGMTEVTVEVTFKQFGRDYNVALTTLTPTETTDSGQTITSTGSGSSSSSSSSSRTTR